LIPSRAAMLVLPESTLIPAVPPCGRDLVDPSVI
jgi:hypothetical protein